MLLHQVRLSAEKKRRDGSSFRFYIIYVSSCVIYLYRMDLNGENLFVFVFVLKKSLNLESRLIFMCMNCCR